MTNWTDKQDAEVLDRVYRMRADGTMSVAQTIPIADSLDRHTFNLMCYGQSMFRLPGTRHE
ncbi:MAG: hypothetical protein C0436_04150 [Alphaproteobacteria bacterium]|nr:hypothetical protein [Alphaproteobacteria bacterium]